MTALEFLRIPTQKENEIKVFKRVVFPAPCSPVTAQTCSPTIIHSNKSNNNCTCLPELPNSSFNRNDLLTAGGFQNEMAAELQVREAVRFDIHLSKGRKD